MEELFAKLMVEQSFREQQQQLNSATPGGIPFSISQDINNLEFSVLNWQSSNTDIITIYPESLWASEGSGSTYGNGLTIVTPVLHDTTASRFVCSFDNTGTGTIKFKYFRRDSSNSNTAIYVTQSIATNIPNIGQGIQTFEVPPWEMKYGDYIGFYISSGATSTIKASTAPKEPQIVYNASDVTSTTTISTRVNHGAFAFYGTNAPFLIYVGDSITTGYPDYRSYWERLTFNGPWPEISRSFELGYQLQQLIPSLVYQDHAYPNKTLDFVNLTGSRFFNRNYKVVLIHAGVNDCQIGHTWTEIGPKFNAIRSQIPSDKIVLVDEILPANSINDVQSAAVRNVNFQLINWCNVNNAYLINCHDDFGVIRGSTSQLDNLNPIYSKDGVHITVLGQQLLAQKIYNKLKEIFG